MDQYLHHQVLLEDVKLHIQYLHLKYEIENYSLLFHRFVILQQISLFHHQKNLLDILLVLLLF